MQIWRSFLAVAALVSPAPAFAEAEPPRAPVPAWVEAQPLPTPDPKQADKPLQTLLYQADTRFGPGPVEQYVDSAVLVQNTQGLAAAGTIKLPWSPDSADLFINKLQIIRGGKAIDILANQHFTVIRRESNLEKAMLDGTLTAVIQPEGLSVGDILELGITLRRKPGALPFAPEELLLVGSDVAIRHVRMRSVWPKDQPLRWSGNAALGRPKLKTVGGNSELVVDLTDINFESPPRDVPARLRPPASLQVTGYGSWEEISRLMAPAYQKAATLAPDSPVKAEIAKIAAASPDPEKRALASLRLVEDEVRYVAVAIGDAGLIPADADQTWAHKYGDCKGKTVLLLAMLKALGIEAEPALVSTLLSDALPKWLPQVRPFDHVLVRARIGGKTYWLDGTRRGDRSLETLVVAPFASALPLTGAGAPLDLPPPVAPPRPLTETNLVYDASKGLSGQIPFTAEQILRGDQAVILRAGLAAMGLDTFKKKLLENPLSDVGGEFSDVKLDVVPEDAEGAAVLRYRGMAKMDWNDEEESKPLRFKFSNETISWTPGFKRSEGPYKDAPVALPYPVSIAATETIILPEGGKGFTLDAHALDKTIAGTRITRSVALENGRAIARSSFVRLRREIEAAEARASETPLTETNDDKAYVVAPRGMRLAAEKATTPIVAVTVDPKDSDGFVARGSKHLEAGELAEAIQDFTRAAALAPKSARPLAKRGMAYIEQGRLDLAQADFAKAATLDDKDFVLHQGLGLVALRRERFDDALKAFNRALELEPGNSATLGWRARTYQMTGRFADALADVDAALKRKPEDVSLLLRRPGLLADLNREDDALAAVDKVQAADPDSRYLGYRAQLLRRFGYAEEAKLAFALAVAETDRLIAHTKGADERSRLRRGRAELLSEIGRKAEALRELDELLAAEPNDATLLNSRCWLRATANLDLPLALADCEAAVKAAPKSAPILDSRAFVKLRLGRNADAVADYDSALALSPGQAASLYGRGLAKLRLGRREAGEADLAAARRYETTIDKRFGDYGMKP